jgi:predicted helicase
MLEAVQAVSGVEWRKIIPDRRFNWLHDDMAADYPDLLSIGTKSKSITENVIFEEFSHGINTARDSDVYNFGEHKLQTNCTALAEAYNSELDRWVRVGQPSKIDDFVDYSKLKWSRNLKRNLKNKLQESFDLSKVRLSAYRPFTLEFVYLSDVLVDELGKMPHLFPTPESENENFAICLSAVSSEKPFLTIATNKIANYHLAGAGSGTQCFPFYNYAEGGSHRRENITDWALEQFRSHYHDPSITKWDIFHYIYAVLHHPDYRERYAANLRRELPRIPFASANTLNDCHPERSEGSAVLPLDEKMQIPRSARDDKSKNNYANSAPSAVKDVDVFRALAKAGQCLTEIHVRYEQQPEYKLTKKEKAGEKLNWRVSKMRLSKDKTTLIYNDFLTLSDIPKEIYDYRLGNRSALEWVIDQYQVSTDKRSGITNDPNREDDPQYIVRLIGQVITVSLETVKIVNELPPLGIPENFAR